MADSPHSGSPGVSGQGDRNIDGRAEGADRSGTGSGAGVHSTRSSRERSESRAQDFRGRRRGYYVINQATDLAVAGPYDDETEAQREADRRNAIPPATDDLVARLIVPDHPGRGGYRHG